MIVTTKVAGKPGLTGLSPETIARGAEQSLRRLQTDHIDVYDSHYMDDDTPFYRAV
ncbi:MAG TPA: aldo/keto reductase [Yaniella sp.]